MSLFERRPFDRRVRLFKFGEGGSRRSVVGFLFPIGLNAVCWDEAGDGHADAFYAFAQDAFAKVKQTVRERGVAPDTGNTGACQGRVEEGDAFEGEQKVAASGTCLFRQRRRFTRHKDGVAAIQHAKARSAKGAKGTYVHRRRGASEALFSLDKFGPIRTVALPRGHGASPFASTLDFPKTGVTNPRQWIDMPIVGILSPFEVAKLFGQGRERQTLISRSTRR
jgi:hypothetical protein